MKKIIIFMMVFLALPYILTYAVAFLNDTIRIGIGGNDLEEHLLGKTVHLEMNGLYKSMDVEEYVLGVLAGVIPADYEEEALKTQAILVRTNVLKEMEEKGTSDEEDLSYDYLTVDERIELWGDRNYEKVEARFEQAVVDTAGMVIKKEGSLIMALYHEVSIGKTASAKEILGEDISYLQSVDSGQDVESKHYMNIKTFTLKELSDITGVELSENGVCVEESSENGFATKVVIGEKAYTGEEAMNLLGLASTNFYVEELSTGLRFVCLGKGTCLGMSQYGANAMAQKGATVNEIIYHYYQDVNIAEYTP